MPSELETLVLRRSDMAENHKMGRVLFTIIFLGLVGCDNPLRSSTGQTEDLPTDTGLVGWWKFDEATGTTANDSSGHANTATIRNGDWGPGKSGGGLMMNGGNDSIVTVPSSDSLRSTDNEITVMSWTYRTNEHNVAIVAHEYPALFFGFHGPQFKWQIERRPDLLPRLARRVGLVRLSGWLRSSRPTRASCYADPKHKALLNEWIHLAATFDGSQAKLYVDGVEICRAPLSGSLPMPNSPFTISGYLDNDDHIVDEITGIVDDVRIYNRALNAGEIQAIYMKNAD